MNDFVNFTPESFDLVKLSLKVQGLTFNSSSNLMGSSNADEIDIIGPSVELSIFEHISFPFLTGKLVLVDDFGLLDFPGIKGTEKVIVEFGHPAPYIKNITKTFIIRSIDSSNTYNDYTNVIIFDLIEDVGFYDRAQRISKGYSGTGEEIIRKILQDKLGKELDTTYCKDSYQQAFRYVVPFLSPMEACMTVLSRMTTATGCPYFLYSSLYSDKIILTDLESILEQDPFNENIPFSFSQGQVSTNNFMTNATTIKKLRSSELEDTLELVEEGAGGIFYNYIIVGNENKPASGHFSAVSRAIESLEAAGTIKPDQFSRLVKEDFIVDPKELLEKTLVEMNSKVVSAIGTSNYPLDNIDSFNEGSSIGQAILSESRAALLLYLTKNIYELEMPGFMFLPSTNNNKNVKLSVGNQIAIKNYKAPETELRSKSGRYVMLAKRHILDIPERAHTISLQCSRITNQSALKG